MELTNKDIERDEQVAMILDKNLLTYHFQPIVSARDGSIYAYEALMRVFAPVRLSPPELLEVQRDWRGCTMLRNSHCSMWLRS